MTRRLSIFAVVATLAVAATPALVGIDPAPHSPATTRNPTQATEVHRPGASGSGGTKAQVRGRLPKPGAKAGTPAGSLSFAEPRNFSTLADPSAAASGYKGDDPPAARVPVTDSVAVGNFDEDPDGHLDVVQTNVLAGSISVFRGNGRGGFGTPSLIPVGINPALVLSRDLDHDSHLDLVIADPGTTNPNQGVAVDAAVITLRGDGHGGFAVTNTIPVNPPPRNLALGDVNDDGVTDIVVASRGATSIFAPLPSAGGAVILSGAIDASGAITFTVAQTVLLTKDHVPVGANSVAVGDFDGEGGDDLAVAVGTLVKSGDRPPGSTQPEGDDLLVYLNRNVGGGDAFGRSESQRFRVGALPEAIAAADWNADGHVDLAVLSPASGDLTSFTNDGKGHFTRRGSTASVGAMARSLEVADFNVDGVADLVTATFLMSTVSVLQGRGDGTFEPAVDFWAGDEPTSVEVGLFDDDKRPDIVAGRVQTDELVLLVNDSPRRGDGVVPTRDIPYVSIADDPTAAHHTLDVWKPAAGTPSFAGRGEPYPVVVFAHGGFGVAGDKTHVSYLMRSLAREGIIGVTIDYRLDGPAHHGTTQADDYASAIRWVHANIGSPRFGGDPDNIFVGGTSAGAAVAVRVAASPVYRSLHPHLRGVFVVGVPHQCAADAAAGVTLPPSLGIAGDQGGEGGGAGNATNAKNFVEAARARGADAEFVQVSGHDHLEIVSNLARPGDLGRVALLRFLKRVMG